MADITIREAKEYAKQMANFFKAFKFVDETLDQAVAVEELLERHKEMLASIQAEIDNLKKQKEEAEALLEKTRTQCGQMMSELQHDVTEAIIKRDETIQQYETEKQKALDDLEAFQKSCKLSKETHKVELEKTIASIREQAQSEINGIAILQREAEEKLAATQAQIDAIKQRL